MSLPNPGMDAVPFTPLTAEFLDDMIENIEALADGTGLDDGSITNAKLSTTTGEIGGAWSSWTPTFTNLSGGTLNYAVYTQVGKLVHFKFKYTLGGAGMGNGPTFTTPTTMADRTSATQDTFNGHVGMNDANGIAYSGSLAWASSTGFKMYALNTSGSTLSYTNITSTVPMSWASGDFIMVDGWYEAA